MQNNELTQLEFNAYKLIKKFVSQDCLLFNLSKLENGYDLKNELHHFKVIEINLYWYLVVVIKDKEYFFNGKNTGLPFKGSRNYNGDWPIFFENILENTIE